MLAPFKRSQHRLQAAQRVKQWTRERFNLAGDTAVLVAELESAQAGFPPLHTRVAFWAAERTHHLRIFKPLQEVVEDDLPPAWYRDALAVPEGLDCGCC